MILTAVSGTMVLGYFDLTIEQLTEKKTELSLQIIRRLGNNEQFYDGRDDIDIVNTITRVIEIKQSQADQLKDELIKYELFDKRLENEQTDSQAKATIEFYISNYKEHQSWDTHTIGG